MHSQFFIFILSIFLSCPICLADQTALSQEDSLKNVLPLQKGEARLETLYKLAQSYIDTPSGIYYADMLDTEAQKAENTQYIYLALIIKTYYYSYQTPVPEDSLIYSINRMKELSRTTGIDTYYFEAEKILLMHEMENDRYEQAIHHTRQVLEEAKERKSIKGEQIAYELLGFAYQCLYCYKEAKEYYEKSYDLLAELPDNFDDHIIIIYRLMDMALKLKDYETSLLYCEKGKQILNAHESKKSGTIYETVTPYFWLTAIDDIVAENYIRTGRISEAKEALDRLSEYAKHDLPEACHQLINEKYALYYQQLHDYKKALGYIENVLDYFRTIDNRTDYYEALDKKIAILADMEDFEEAYTLSREAKQFRDSTFTERITRQLSEFGVIYEVEKLEMDVSKNRLEKQKIVFLLIGLTIIVLLLAGIIVYIRRNAARLKEKNHILFQQLKEQDEKANEMNRLYPSSGSPEETVPPVSEEDPLYTQIIQYLKRTQSFLEPEMNRDILSRQMGVNWKYMCDSIKQESGLTFNDFINNFRLEYAKKQILTDSNQSIESVLSLSGFISKSTFYRLFREKYGLTPLEFRELAKQENGMPVVN
jgi:AraC-like DNA-binding protein